MKKQFTQLFLVMVMVFSSLTIYAASFLAGGIKYVIIDEANKEVEVAQYTSGGASQYRGNIVIPATVTNAGITYNVTTIGEKAFYESFSLTGVTMPEGLKTIKRWCFYKCRGVKGFTLPESLETLAEAAFHTCSGLTEITIPSNVTTFEQMMFRDCSDLKTINLLMKEASITLNSFNGCDALIAINVDPASAKCKSIDGVLFSKGGSGLWRYPASKESSSYVIPSDVVSIEANAFENSKNLESLEFPAKAKTINALSFNNCTALKTIKIHAATPPTCNTTSFSGVDKTKCSLYVLQGKKDAYTAANGWKDFNNILEFSPTNINIENIEGINVNADNKIIIVNGNEDNLPVKVISLLGKVVYSGISNNIDVDNSGIYIVTVGDNKFKCYVK